MADLQEYFIRQKLPLTPEKAFRFFSDEKNLDSMTPDWYSITILGKNHPKTRKGTTLDYRFVIHGIPLKWRSRIVEWSPTRAFSYEQEIGPFAHFHHDHFFKKVPGGCEMTDRVLYRLRGGWFGHLLMGQGVKWNLDGIFQYRKRKAAELFSAHSH